MSKPVQVPVDLSYLENKTIFITGGTGFIGSRLVQTLSSNSRIRIIVLSRKRRECGNDNCECIEGDLCDSTSLKILKETGDIDYVLYLAAKIPNPSIPQTLCADFSPNIHSLSNFLEILPGPVSRFIFASTIDVYGVPLYNPIDEIHPTNPGTYYGVSKMASENILKIFLGERKIPLTVLRYSQVYGPGEPMFKVIPVFIDTMAKKHNPPTIYGDGSDVRDFVYVDDAVSAAILALCSEKEGTFNIGTGTGTSISQIVDIINQASGQSIRPVYRERKKGRFESVYNISLAEKYLGYRPSVGISEGIAREIRWASQNLKGLDEDRT